MPAVIAGALVLIAATAVTTYLLARPPAAAAKPKTIEVAGTFTLTDSIGVLNLDDVHCEGMGGYKDIHDGASVVVTDASGRTVAVGALKNGTLVGEGMTRTCMFFFNVSSVPAGLSFYGVEVSHRGSIKKAEADLTAMLALTLG